jgi:hypothetical protein
VQRVYIAIMAPRSSEDSDYKPTPDRLVLDSVGNRGEQPEGDVPSPGRFLGEPSSDIRARSSECLATTVALLLEAAPV